jgi:nitrilase
MSIGNSTQQRIAAQVNAFKVAAIQMASGPNVAGNISEARRLIANAAEKGARLVALPEFFAIMGMTELDKLKVAEPVGSGPIQQFLSDTAKQHKIW